MKPRHAALGLIRQFWSRLEDSVHPDDKSLFDDMPNSFHRKFPPPAFLGAIDTAPIVLLMANGGYSLNVTESEFPDGASILRFRDHPGGVTDELPLHVAPYYGDSAFGPAIRAGEVAVANAVAYRSPRLSQEPDNRRLARKLPSLDAHRRWLFEELLPAAERGERFVLVHRNGWWRVPKTMAGPTIVFSDPKKAEPNRRQPSRENIEAAFNWLRNRTRPAP